MSTNRTEEILFELVEDNKNSKAYVTKILSNFSHICKQIITSSDTRELRLYLLNAHFKQTNSIIHTSYLTGKPLTYLLNVINQRYRKFVTQRPNPLTNKIRLDLLEGFIGSDQIDEFKNIKKDDLILYHSTLGRYIRNTYIYGNKSIRQDFKDVCADDLSFEIIESLWETLQKKETE